MSIAIALGAMLCAAPQSAGPVPPEGFAEVGGSNYVMYRVDDRYRLDGDDVWYEDGVLWPVVGTFHRMEAAEVRDQLAAMHANGQRKIAFMLWYMHFPEALQADPWPDVHGHVVRANGGSLTPQHARNLRALLRILRETNFFNEVVFRFALQGSTNPGSWEAWNEARYQENWRFTESTRAIVLEELAASDIKVRFDLGAELGGLTKGQLTPYLERFWKQYTEAYGTQDTVGFSYATAPGRVAEMLRVYDLAGKRPEVLAVDLYERAYERMVNVAEEARAAGIERPRIIVLETFYNDAQALRELQRAQRDCGLDYLYLMQWPLKRGHSVRHFSEHYPREYGAYLGSNPPSEND